MQLHSAEQERSQSIDAHAAAFSTLTSEGRETSVIVFATRSFTHGTLHSKVHCIALDGTHRKHAELFFPAVMPSDHPVFLHIRCAATW